MFLEENVSENHLSGCGFGRKMTIESLLTGDSAITVLEYEKNKPRNGECCWINGTCALNHICLSNFTCLCPSDCTYETKLRLCDCGMNFNALLERCRHYTDGCEAIFIVSVFLLVTLCIACCYLYAIRHFRIRQQILLSPPRLMSADSVRDFLNITEEMRHNLVSTDAANDDNNPPPYHKVSSITYCLTLPQNRKLEVESDRPPSYCEIMDSSPSLFCDEPLQQRESNIIISMDNFTALKNPVDTHL